jgi:hypothetical protein
MTTASFRPMNEFSQIVMRRRLRRRHPTGIFFGLLAGSLVTLIGVACQLDPFAICCRALISGFAVGAVMSVGASLIRLANLEPEAAPAGAGRRGGDVAGRRERMESPVRGG